MLPQSSCGSCLVLFMFSRGLPRGCEDCQNHAVNRTLLSPGDRISLAVLSSSDTAYTVQAGVGVWVGRGSVLLPVLDVLQEHQREYHAFADLFFQWVVIDPWFSLDTTHPVKRRIPVNSSSG